MLDFDNIISGVAGQRETFEELACQVLRRLPPHHDAEFRRIHGAGGDGGVEAVWILPDGTEHGVQAKYHTKAAQISWSGIDKSIFAALAAHPKLTRIYVAIACPLTGQTGRRTKSGKPTITAWDQWETHKAKWEAEAQHLGRTVAFVPWSAADLEDLLAQPQMTGLIDYWFGGIELSPSWLRTQAARTIAGLEERYHPEDHVDVGTRMVFEALLRTEEFRNALLAARDAALAEANRGPIPEDYPEDLIAKLERLSTDMAAFRDATAVLETVEWQTWPFKSWSARCADLMRRVFDVVQPATAYRDALRAAAAATNDKTPPYAARDTRYAVAGYIVESLLKLRSEIGRFDELIGEPSCEAAGKRFAFLDGRAGSGKSHLIASEVERALDAAIPALFLLGTDFTVHAAAEPQILARLEIPGGKFDALLGALNAKAEAGGTRALIAIDAINEGAGATLWRPALQAFATRVLDFPRLTLCVSCRREYTEHLRTPAVDAMAATVEVRGFETAAEVERAATVYMDRRGIVRPGTPWFNPEFSNPLFLRTTCLALQREGRSAYPRGMRGTSEVLAFFLESTARHLGTDYDGSDRLIGPTKQALLDIAADMAAQQRDFAEFRDAHAAVDAAFRGFAPPPGKSWVEILRFRGLLRIDPNPALAATPSDPLATPPDVVRFSFQRFQDHLIAQALLRDKTTAAGLFDAGGPLAFVLDRHGIRWDWRGVFYALYVHVADRFHTELVDCLPGGTAKWWGEWEVEDAFIESIRWRATDAFTARSVELLNAVRRSHEDVIALLVEVAIVADHPWNAEFLHGNLTKRSLPRRDAFWTQSINRAFDDEGHPAVRLIDWAANPGITLAKDRVLSLVATTLAWLCASTGGELRDRATKALTAIFVDRPSLAGGLFARFAGCDDIYILERLTAALYGAALRTTLAGPLRIYARVAWSNVFAGGKPPMSLLVRDYARGTIELAAAADALDTDVVIAHCRPPYGSAPPRFTNSAARVEARAARLGAETIIRSCYKGLADFGRYTVEHRVERFAAAPLSGPRPETAEESAQRFMDDFAERPDVLFALEDLKQAHADRSIHFDPETFSTLTPEEDNWRIANAEAALLARLTPAQIGRFRREADPWARGMGRGTWTIPGKTGEGKPVNAKSAKVWIANRAMSLGWTKTLFPSDRTYGEDRIRGSKVERIGKKYQRIAFGELLARLADNYWLAPHYDVPAHLYDNPIDIEFVRDIDPSILPTDFTTPLPPEIPRVPRLVSASLPPGQRGAWVREPKLAEHALSLATGSDLGTNDWLALYRYASCDIDMPDQDKLLDEPWQQSEFYFASLLLLPDETRDRFVAETEAHADDFHEWLPSGNVDGPFLRELSRRATWPVDPWSILETRNLPARTYKAIRGSTNFQWESHLDGSLPDGAQFNLPTSWMMAELGLNFAPGHQGLLVDDAGVPIVFAGSGPHSSYVFVRREQLVRLAAAHGLTPVMTVIGERMGITKPGVRLSMNRVRYNGLQWFEGNAQKTKSWFNFD